MLILILPGLTAATAAIAGLTAFAASSPAQAASDISIAAIASGRLYVVGTTERPHTPVSLDARFTTESDDAGKFQYELVYHPARCIVAVKIEGKTYEAVVSNCGQQGPPGPAGPPSEAAAPAGAVAAGTPPIPDTKAADVPAAALPAVAIKPPPLPSARPEPAQLTPPATDRGKSVAAPAKTTAPRTVVHAAPPQPRKPTPKVRVKRQDPDEGEIPVAD